MLITYKKIKLKNIFCSTLKVKRKIKSSLHFSSTPYLLKMYIYPFILCFLLYTQEKRCFQISFFFFYVADMWVTLTRRQHCGMPRPRMEWVGGCLDTYNTLRQVFQRPKNVF